MNPDCVDCGEPVEATVDWLHGLCIPCAKRHDIVTSRTSVIEGAEEFADLPGLRDIVTRGRQKRIEDLLAE